jgi:CRP-like cAMP-binding protein
LTLESFGDVQRLFLRYTQALTMQLTQTAVCNQHHNVDQKPCRWLLFSLDRLPTHKMHVTQDLIAFMLGVRRAGATRAAKKLRAAGHHRVSPRTPCSFGSTTVGS